MTIKSIAGGLAFLALLAGCAEREVILEGQRLALRAPLDGAAPLDEPATALEERAPITIPQQVAVRNWTHRAGTPTHRIAHSALSAAPTLAWSVGVGEGNGKRSRITADPVVADGRVFVMDSRARVSAVTESGGILWSRDLTPANERSRDASGGGLAVADGTVYATTGFGALHAIDVQTGGVRWTQELGAVAAGAPTVDGELVYLVSRDSRAWAIARDNGRIRWTLPGTPTPSNVVGGPSPAVTDKLAIFPFGSGELVATLKRGGIRVWASAVSGSREGRAFTSVTDITADPVIDGDRIYTGTPAGRLVALELTSGDRIWTASEGAMGPVWPVGGSVFAISDQAELIRIDAATGGLIWSRELPFFEATRLRRRKSIVPHFGPVLAGGRLWVASGDGAVRGYDPQTGDVRASLPVRAGAVTRPVVANGTLYVVSGRGQLHAFR